MRKLWVRMSIVISGLMLFILTLLLLGFALFSSLEHFDYEPSRRSSQHQPGDVTGGVIGEERPDDPINSEYSAEEGFNPWHHISGILLRTILLAALIGLVGSAVASWLLVAPITKLVDAARAIGSGNLTTRVDVAQSSQEIDELAEAFNTMAADLQHATETRNNLLADVSHELRTPLTVLEGNLRAALDHVVELDDERIANLYSQTDHLIQLVNDLRELTLAEAAQLPLDRQPIHIVQLVQETLTVFEPLAEEEEIVLTIDLPTTVPSVTIDSARIRQVLHNLLANALYYTPTGGTITVSLHENQTEIQIAIQDSGEGIAPDQLEHLFNRFYRTDPSRSRESGGSGLGLAIVKAIVEAHGGWVKAESGGLGLGSTFTIALPTTMSP